MLLRMIYPPGNSGGYCGEWSLLGLHGHLGILYTLDDLVEAELPPQKLLGPTVEPAYLLHVCGSSLGGLVPLAEANLL